MVSSNQHFLVVGSEGLIGSNLVSYLNKAGMRVTSTTRNRNHVSANCLYLNLADEENLDINIDKYSCTFICAGITNLAKCEADPENSKLVNVINSLNLMRRLHSSGSMIIYLSSNTVFDCKNSRQNENDNYSPSTEYGRQKVEVEKALKALPTDAVPVAIVRLSKVVSSHSGIASDFIAKFSANQPCIAFNDLLVSPISIEYTLAALGIIASKRLSGIFHLAGVEEMTYAQFAHMLALHMGANPLLIKQLSSVDAKAKILFRPAHPGLGMKLTYDLTGIEPESTTHLMNTFPNKHRKILREDTI